MKKLPDADCGEMQIFKSMRWQEAFSKAMMDCEASGLKEVGEGIAGEIIAKDECGPPVYGVKVYVRVVPFIGEQLNGKPAIDNTKSLPLPPPSKQLLDI